MGNLLEGMWQKQALVLDLMISAAASGMSIVALQPSMVAADGAYSLQVSLEPLAIDVSRRRLAHANKPAKSLAGKILQHMARLSRIMCTGLWCLQASS